MKSKTVILAILAGFAFAAAGCGAPEKTLKQRALEDVSEDVDPVALAAGDVKPVEVEETATEKPSEAPVAPETESAGDVVEGPQGAFVATLKVLGKDEPGTFRVLTATDDPQVVQENVPTGQEIRLDPGVYDFEFSCEVVAGGKKMTLRGVEIQSGRRVKREVKWPVGKLTLVTGAKCAKAPIKIKEKGAEEWLPGKFFTCVEIILPAGYYDAERGNTPISGIQVYDGGIQQVMIRPKN